jgi:two-component system, response regulator PdtaR
LRMKNQVKVLLVEDEVITAMAMKMELEKIGCKVIKNVTTGENAIISAKENRPDIIFMDIMLAGEIDGIDAASIINKESGTSIPVIFCTAYNDNDIRKRAELLNPLGFLLKPLERRKLAVIINSFLTSGSMTQVQQ